MNLDSTNNCPSRQKYPIPRNNLFLKIATYHTTQHFCKSILKPYLEFGVQLIDEYSLCTMVYNISDTWHETITISNNMIAKMYT